MVSESADPIALAIEIVAAFVARNSVPPSEFTRIDQIGALSAGGNRKWLSRSRRCSANRIDPCCPGPKIDNSRLSHLFGRWPEIQIAA
jgi:hypothetical protein